MIQLRFLGHSCWLIETGSARLIIDPFLTGNPAAAARAEDIEVDTILVTHGHSDHIGDALDIAKRCDALVIGCFEVATFLGAKGARVHPMHLGGAHVFPFGRVKMIPALHGSGFEENGQIVYLGSPAGFVLEIDSKVIYHAGDTALFTDMRLVSRTRPVDLALLPIGDNFTMGTDDAVEAVKLINPALVVPIHYNTFDLIRADADAFCERVTQETSSKCQVVKPGEEISL